MCESMNTADPVEKSVAIPSAVLRAVRRRIARRGGSIYVRAVPPSMAEGGLSESDVIAIAPRPWRRLAPIFFTSQRQPSRLTAEK